MTRFRSRILFVILPPVLAGCAASSGVPATAIAQPAIAAAYLPLHASVHLGIDSADGAAVVIAPGIAVTNSHNANLLDGQQVIGTARDYDLMFFRTPHQAAPATAPPVAGEAVTAYGQGTEGELRVAHGVVREIHRCDGCGAPAWFTFSNPKRQADDAGPGFSGGPVLDGAGRLVGITFGYRDSGGERLIYAYDMARVGAEFSALRKAANSP
ncbi:MAG TPA: trypsin-like peptidase domain-containing protein [Rhizomicrobium sp.]|nr:trypsin-like peptidase domain-containing protein [Rhizomicrobium sp.]